jgi:hypothetical protein
MKESEDKGTLATVIRWSAKCADKFARFSVAHWLRTCPYVRKEPPFDPQELAGIFHGEPF